MGSGVPVPPKPRRTPRHQDTAWRSVTPAIGHDDWQRQADAAAWSAVSGMPASLYLGAIEPIPIPPDLRQRLREAGKALAAEPSAHRADALLRLAHRAVYGIDAPGTPLEAAAPPAGGGAEDWWSETPAEGEKPLAPPCSPAALEQHATEAFAALQASEWTPEDGGEVPREETSQWWT